MADKRPVLGSVKNLCGVGRISEGGDSLLSDQTMILIGLSAAEEDDRMADPLRRFGRLRSRGARRARS